MASPLQESTTPALNEQPLKPVVRASPSPGAAASEGSENHQGLPSASPSGALDLAELFESAAAPTEADAPADNAVEQQEEVEESSEDLARRLMREESLLAYRQLQQATVQMALEAMQSGDGEVDEDTRLALQMMQDELRAMGGGEEDLAALVQAAGVAREAEAVEEDQDPDSMDYDQLLRLGEELGDVKTERWRMRAPQVIAALPRRTVEEPTAAATAAAAAADDSDDGPMCAICRCGFEAGDTLIVVRCRHEFHEDCAAQWLQDHSTCPMCKVEVERTPRIRRSPTTPASTASSSSLPRTGASTDASAQPSEPAASSTEAPPATPAVPVSLMDMLSPDLASPSSARPAKRDRPADSD